MARNDRRSTDETNARLVEAVTEALIASDTAAEDIRTAARKAGLGHLVDEHERAHPRS